MVERPIKKSERQATTAGNAPEIVLEVDLTKTAQDPATQAPEDAPENSSENSLEKRNIPRPLPAKDKEKVEGKGRRKEKERDSNRPPLNPALMRGPKPTKPKPPVVQETPDPPAEDSVAEPEQAVTTEG